MVANDNGNDVLRSNTSYNNNGPGYEISTTDANLDSVANNIGFGNSVGMRRNGAGAVVLTMQRLVRQPRRCNLRRPRRNHRRGARPEVLQLARRHRDARADLAPLLSLAGCGLVGRSVWAARVPSPSISEAGSGLGRSSFIRNQARAPSVSRGLNYATPIDSEIYDAQGALRWSADAAAGSRGLTWHPRQAGSVPPGIYFARLRDRPELGGSRGHDRELIQDRPSHGRPASIHEGGPFECHLDRNEIRSLSEAQAPSA